MAPRADERRPLPDDLADLIAACLAPQAPRRPSMPALLRALAPIAKLLRGSGATGRRGATANGALHVLLTLLSSPSLMLMQWHGGCSRWL
jgi:hypothetical protein